MTQLNFSLVLRTFILQMELFHYYGVQKSHSNALEKVLHYSELGHSGLPSYMMKSHCVLPVSDSASL